MTNDFKLVTLIAIGVAHLSSFAAYAEVPLFNFTLTVQDVANPQIFVGRDKKPVQGSGSNTFEVDVRKSDYVFLVQYAHNGQNKEALCPISGAPTKVTAIIDPTKTGREACTTQESRQGEAMAAL